MTGFQLRESFVILTCTDGLGSCADGRAEYNKILYERELEELMTPASEALERRALYQVLLDGNEEVAERAHQVFVIFSQDKESAGETVEELEDLFYSWYEFGDDLLERMTAHSGWTREERGDKHELRQAIFAMDRAMGLLEAFIPWAVDKSKPMPQPDIHHRYHEAMQELDDLLIKVEPKCSLLVCVLGDIEVPVHHTEEEISACKTKIAKQESLIAQEAAGGLYECKVQDRKKHFNSEHASYVKKDNSPPLDHYHIRQAANLDKPFVIPP
ncbi:hypothetical protein CC79DRAFT_1320886 [Sarocladium strictum]